MKKGGVPCKAYYCAQQLKLKSPCPESVPMIPAYIARASAWHFSRRAAALFLAALALLPIKAQIGPQAQQLWQQV